VQRRRGDLGSIYGEGRGKERLSPRYSCPPLLPAHQHMRAPGVAGSNAGKLYPGLPLYFCFCLLCSFSFLFLFSFTYFILYC
jgi:hypothetical protein